MPVVALYICYSRRKDCRVECHWRVLYSIGLKQDQYLHYVHTIDGGFGRISMVYLQYAPLDSPGLV